MRKILSLYPYALVALMVFFTACEQDRAFPEFADVQTGAVPRQIGDTEGTFDFENIDGSQLTFTVEFYDVNQGRDVSSYSWAVTYAGMGPASIKSFDSSQFSPNSDGFPQITITITFNEVLAALGITSDGIVPGESFTLLGSITMNDGRVFDANNTTSNVQGQPLFNGLFQIRQGVENVPCFSKLAGTFDAAAAATNQMAGIGWDDCDGNNFTTTVIWNAEHDPEVFGTGTYFVESLNANGEVRDDVSMGIYYTCYTSSQTNDGGNLPLGDVRVNDDCGSLFFTGSSQWGELYSFNAVSANGADLTLDIVNDYGEGGSVRLTRQDGMDWPGDLKDGD